MIAPHATTVARTLPIAALLFLLLSASSAEPRTYPPQTTSFDLGPMPALGMPAYLGSVTEPGLGTAITRIADQRAFATTQRVVAHSYATMEAWNCDGTRMMITQGQYPYVFLDGNTYAITGRHRPPQGAIWSPTQPDIMYGIRSNSSTEKDYVSFDVGTDTFTVLKTFSDYTGLRYSGEEHVSLDGRYTCLLGYKGADLYLVSFDIARREMIAERRLGSGLAVGDDDPNGVNAIMMSQKGNFILVVYKTAGTGPTQGVHLYDRNLNYVRAIVPISHSDMGLDENGDEVLVCQTGETTQRAVCALRLSDNRKTVVLDNEKMGYNQHISCRNIARPGWAYVSDFELGNAARPNENKVFALKLDGSQTVEFFAWARRSETIEYDRGVMVCPNPDGTKVVFRSDWGDAADAAVVYSYVATMPAPAGAELDIARGPTAIADGGSDTVAGTVAGSAAAVEYQLTNRGAATLALTLPVVVSATNNCSATVSAQPSASLAAGASSGLTVTVTPAAAGPWSFSLAVTSNDGDENPYRWTVRGTAPAGGGAAPDGTGSGNGTGGNRGCGLGSGFTILAGWLALLIVQRRRGR